MAQEFSAVTLSSFVAREHSGELLALRSLKITQSLGASIFRLSGLGLGKSS